MTFPTFLGIGVPRAGTTWLHTLLTGPSRRLPAHETPGIRFFDRYHERGIDWYESFFCPPEEADDYRAIGEMSPQYFYCEEGPGRISALLPEAKLLVMLRHPVDRAYSQYGFVVQRRNYRDSFEEFLATRPNALEMGFYSRHLSHYLDFFDASQILVLVFEEAVADGGRTRRSLAEFLGVSAHGFPTSLGRVNASTVPKHGWLSSVAVKTGRTLRRKHLESVVNIGARLGGRSLLAKGSAIPRLDPRSKRDLSHLYEDEFEELERLMRVDLNVWRS